GTSAPARARRNGKGCGRALGLAEERTQARGRLFLRDFLFFLLFLFLLLFFLLGGRRCRGSGGWHCDGGLEGLVDVHAFQRCGQGFHASLVDFLSVGREYILLDICFHGLPVTVQSSRTL